MVVASKSGATRKVRDMLFEDWWKANIATVAGGALAQEAIFKAYRREMDARNALGQQGFERMLNSLGIKRSVRQGKIYRLGVGFVRVASGADAPPLTVAAQSAAPPPPAAPAEDNFAVQASMDVFQERLRQRLPTSERGEGFDAAHDEASDPGAHERAAACYAYAAAQPEGVTPFVDFNVKSAGVGRIGYIVRDTIVMMWPWSVRWWKPKTDAPGWKRRCLVKAGALILAAIERHDREKAREALAEAQASQMTGI